ncbi:MAG TPA: CofH family radical SAM protein [Candidatus Poseidoniales archaeon]|nr:MAG: aminofutalosine synthase MqnE [Euryarchaeota archaeon]HIG03974.1 CofH family radical SAM protein [Candidatus Poseidoniales archaeon]HIK79200.1 CofH family radical SAM protein [Candidatus Poseidoniales archaeon]
MQKTRQPWSSDQYSAGINPEWQMVLANLLSPQKFPLELQDIVNKVSTGQRLSIEDGLILYNHPSLTDVARIANAARQARFSNDVFFNHNVHVNQTNLCILSCKFCAFSRTKKSADAYALSIDDYLQQISLYAPFVDEVHTVGGLHPDWGIEQYEGMFSAVKKMFPNIHIKALTAVEVNHLSVISGLGVSETLIRLRDAGLDSLPGGGAEILDDSIRDIICRGKETTAEYLEIHRCAHEIGMPTNCTMLYGTIETIEQRLNHLDLLRRQQDESGGFQCFVPYPFLPDSSRLPEAQLATGTEILRTMAISRLMLDNIPHLKAYRMNLGDEISELALQFGADDLDGTVQQESIMHLAGSTTPLDSDMSQLAKIIYNAGKIPILRNSKYTNFTEYIATDPKTKPLKGKGVSLRVI